MKIDPSKLDEYELTLYFSSDLADQIALETRLALKERGLDPDEDWYISGYCCKVEENSGVTVTSPKLDFQPRISPDEENSNRD